jgi:NAD(P)H-dependent flavin oxidoreductase YrpB (nitropropane dioxygenase family)
VAAAGGVGVISTAQIGYRDPDFARNPIECNLKAVGEEIQKARSKAAGGVIGVNIMVATRRYEDYVRAAAAVGVDLIISGAGLPMTLPELAGSAKIAPIVSSQKALRVIAKHWKKKYDRKPDLVVIEGPLAGGHLGFSKEDIEAYTVTGEKDYDAEIRDIIALADELEVPVVVACMSAAILITILRWGQRGYSLPRALSRPESAMHPMRTSRRIWRRRRRIS